MTDTELTVATGVAHAWNSLYSAALAVIALLLVFCLVRAVMGPRIADRVIAINLMGTLVVLAICILAYLLREGYLVDIALIYTMLSFLAVVLLTKIYMGVYRQHRKEEKRDD